MEIICCNPIGKHSLKPCIASKRTKSTFRPITEAIRFSSAVLLPQEGFICNSCRLAVTRKRNESETVDDQSQVEVPKDFQHPHELSHSKETACASKPIKSVVCSNPLLLHVTPRRKKSMEDWYRMTGELLEKAQKIQLPRPVVPDEILCLKCRHKIYKIHAETFNPGIYCSDPSMRHLKPFKKNFLTAFREVTSHHVRMAERLGQSLNEGQFICWKCEQKLKNAPESNGSGETDEVDPMEVDFDAADNNENLQDSQESSSSEEENSVLDDEYIDSNVAEVKIGLLCSTLGIEFKGKGQFRAKQDCLKLKMLISAKVDELLCTFLKSGRSLNDNDELGCKDCHELVEKLVQKFRLAESMSDKYRCMTSTPMWVSLSGLESLFSISRSTAIKVSKLRRESGPISCPPPKLGKKLEPKTVELVKLFYRDDSNSRFSPSARDTIFIWEADKFGVLQKRLVQKKEIMCSLKQLYSEFLEKYSDQKVSLSKFATLRPKECKWGFKNGFKNSCLCTIHTNFKLLCEGIGVKGRTLDILSAIFCSQEEACMTRACCSCPNFQYIKDIVETWEQPIIEFWCWENQEGSSFVELHKKSKSKDEYLKYFENKIFPLAAHHFIFSKQQAYIQGLKDFEHLESNVGVVNVDFGENYSFVVPNEVQGFHWNNSQATVHPFCLYFKRPQGVNVERFSYIVTSDHLKHDATSFHVFRHFFVNVLKEKFPWINEVIFISDGAGSQYKNIKNFSNLFYHFKDFGVKARWVFSATAHGKDVVDAMSALTKRLVRLESLRRERDFILTAEDMCNYLRSQNNDVDKEFAYISKADVLAYENDHNLKDRYALHKPVDGTRSFHYIEVMENSGLVFKTYAQSPESYIHLFVEEEADKGMVDTLSYGHYAGFVRSGIVYIGMVIAVDNEVGEVSIQTLKQVRSSFTWPNNPDIKIFSMLDFVCRLEAPSLMTSSARQYKFSRVELEHLKTDAKKITLARQKNSCLVRGT